jgi:hypothetical protein
MEIVPSQGAYDSVIDALTQHGCFTQSIEYKQLIGNAGDLPGVVASAYARFMARLIKTSPDMAVDILVEPLNLIASWDDSRVNTMLQDEVIEQLEADEIINKVEPKFSNKFMELLRLFRNPTDSTPI